MNSYIDGEILLFKGEEHELRRAERDFPQLSLEGGIFLLAKNADGFTAFESWYKRAPYYELRETLPGWTRRIGVAPQRVSVKTVSTLWGSCSSRASLTFCTRLALVPPELLEYVVVHELCHLKFMNHSPQFWNEVAGYLPDYKNRRKLLRVNAQTYKWW